MCQHAHDQGQSATVVTLVIPSFLFLSRICKYLIDVVVIDSIIMGGSARAFLDWLIILDCTYAYSVSSCSLT